MQKRFQRFGEIFNKKRKYFWAFFILFLALGTILGGKDTEFRTGEAPVSPELGFTSLSPAGLAGGEIIPASCESGYTHDDPNSCDFFNFEVSGYAPGWSSGYFSGYSPVTTVPYGSSVPLVWSWDSTYENGSAGTVTSCIASDSPSGSGGWSGEKVNDMYHWYWYFSNGYRYAFAREGTASSAALTQNTTFTLTCTIQWADGSVSIGSKSRPVTVTGAPPAVNLTFSPSTIAYGTFSSLRLTSQNADTCNIYLPDRSGRLWRGPLSSNYYNPQVGPYTASFTLTAYCTGPNGEGSAAATLTVNPPTGATLEVRPSSMLLYIGGVQNARAWYDADGTGSGGAVDVTTQAAWSSGIPSIATVNSGGTVTGVSQGTSKITAQYSGVFAGSDATVRQQPPCDTSCNRDSEVCEGVSYTNACGQSICTGSRDCGFDWEEVAP